MKNYLTEAEAEEKYGKEMLKKMGETGYLDGITCTVKDGVIYTPARDYEIAYKAVAGKRIHPYEVD
jgi:hypothetical protein